MGEHFTIVPEGSITTPQGFRAGGLHCGLKKIERNDLGAIVCDVPASAAGVYTLNAFQAAPLRITQESVALSAGKLQAVLVNSGNANACTGDQGEADAIAMRDEFADALGIDRMLVGVASTGVIGELLPMEKVRAGIAGMPATLKADGGEDFCQAILTTDLVQKMTCVQLKVGDAVVHIAGAAKGSGMIHPNMATMLGFMTTDAWIEPAQLHQLLREATDTSFNMVTVDGDTSTNDMVVVLASGLAAGGSEPLTPAHPDWDAFVAGFRFVAEYLAKAIACDGEGATKLIEVSVQNADNIDAARAIAKTIVGSSLVKSACFGADANWGRIIAATGRAGVPVNVNTVDVRLGDISVLEQSRPVKFDEELALAYLKGDQVNIYVNLNMGSASATAWGCDLTYDYVRINAAYRT
ncbi:bifunctional glutamate N-acetyltransferase/amino-acid acetyltransferase ArgJ [Paenibacillus albiflavus]|uniref:Arginine biosynthesis bifunctional protein ArgJ n=1 Tax=Paenibacillus albiflavus TaxID=2545760 RepID=A0A4R4ECH8_9BACL|nr:bifunctional glutamate N-acetyltransferase/amino-acid acetyltransferase ArgJ [Paenibacillus albiflavus]TCZ76863.1 bifunctional glutamate N-acetyltransferase/amino-acid acetyltransferase ArgJ [Paenibacillus albiflavus]